MHSLSDLMGNDAGISGKRGKKNYRGVGSENRWWEVTANGQVGSVSGDRWVQLSSAVTFKHTHRDPMSRSYMTVWLCSVRH
jgi:uncharacterized protein with gpF-like domain